MKKMGSPQKLPFGVLFLSVSSDFLYKNFPNENGESSFLSEEQFSERGRRFGIIIERKKQGKWLSGDADFDENGNVYAKEGIRKEEYFKKGLRDSIFKQFDSKGKIFYETTYFFLIIPYFLK